LEAQEGTTWPGTDRAKRIALAHDPKLRPDYIETVEVHPVVLGREHEESKRPVDPIWDPWDPLSQ